VVLAEGTGTPIHHALVGGTVIAWPLVARAQQSAMPVIGFLRPSRADESGHLFAALRQGLRESGYPTDKITIEARWADDQAERLPSLASELVNLQGLGDRWQC
jgi:putative ABC transport system substrate-binding protein